MELCIENELDMFNGTNENYIILDCNSGGYKFTMNKLFYYYL